MNVIIHNKEPGSLETGFLLNGLVPSKTRSVRADGRNHMWGGGRPLWCDWEAATLPTYKT
jgi:hypothetical protein